jgi:hypothetical protein
VKIPNKGGIRSHKSNDSQYNCQKKKDKRTNNDGQKHYAENQRSGSTSPHNYGGEGHNCCRKNYLYPEIV